MSTSVRHPGRQIVSAKSARLLRKRGESVWFDHTLPSGKARYSWSARFENAQDELRDNTLQLASTSRIARNIAELGLVPWKARE
jgi:hypothetical protein